MHSSTSCRLLKLSVHSQSRLFTTRVAARIIISSSMSRRHELRANNASHKHCSVFCISYLQVVYMSLTWCGVSSIFLFTRSFETFFSLLLCFSSIAMIIAAIVIRYSSILSWFNYYYYYYSLIVSKSNDNKLMIVI